MTSFAFFQAFLICFICLYCCAINIEYAYPSRFTGDQLNSVYYLSWIFVPNQPYKINNTDSTYLPYPSRSDDTPVQPVKLPFLYNFLGVNHRVAFVSANGFVAFDTTDSPPCPSCFSYLLDSNGRINFLDVGYFGLIAGFTTDLNPSASQRSKISVSASANEVTFHFIQLQLWNQSRFNNSFHIRLFKDGGVQIYLENIRLQSSYPAGTSDYLLDINNLIVGLRTFSKYYYPQRFFFASVDQVNDQKTWKTSMPGIYPNRSLIQSQSIFIACPMSTLWCLSTERLADEIKLSLTDPIAATNDVNISISTLSPISCQDRYKSIWCSMTFTNLAHNFTVKYIAEASILYNYRVFVCPISQVFIKGNLSQPWSELNSWNISVSLLGEFLENGKYYLPGDKSSSNSNVKNVNILVSPLSGMINGLCAVSGLYPSSAIKSCGRCALCNDFAGGTANLNKTCLRRLYKCPLTSVYDIPNPTCKPQCPAVSGATSSAISLSIPTDTLSFSDTSGRNREKLVSNNVYGEFTNDVSGATCCNYKQIDCSGFCGNAHKIGFNKTSKVYSCCEAKDLDCEGTCHGTAYPDCLGICRGNATYDCSNTCNGKAIIDACGVCAGGKTGKLPINQRDKCNAGLEISPNVSYPIVAKVPYLNRDRSLNGTYKMALEFRNPNIYAIDLKIYISALSPRYNYDPVVTIRPNNSGIIHIASQTSYSAMLTISLNRLLNKRIAAWDVKSIIYSYKRSSSNYKFQNISVQIEPAVIDCFNIFDGDVCINAPYCIWCQDNDAENIYRRQLAISDDEYGTTEFNKPPINSNTILRNIRRALFNSIINQPPDSLVNSDITGVCRNGLTQSVCPDRNLMLPAKTNTTITVFLILLLCPLSIILLIKLKSSRLIVGW